MNDKKLPNDPIKKGLVINDDTESVSQGNSNDIEISSIEEFIYKTEELITQGFTFFRGDKSKIDQERDLLFPKIYKSDYDTLLKNHDLAIEEFASLSVGKSSIESDDFFEIMINAQHYEFPTRLLDWTESALIALYFSVFHYSQTSDLNKKSIVWFLNPLKLNEKSKLYKNKDDCKKIPLISPEENKELSKVIKKYYKGLESRPIAIKTRKINPRIDAQRGVFVLFPHGDNKKSLTDYDDASDFYIRYQYLMRMQEKYTKF